MVGRDIEVDRNNTVFVSGGRIDRKLSHAVDLDGHCAIRRKPAAADREDAARTNFAGASCDLRIDGRRIDALDVQLELTLGAPLEAAHTHQVGATVDQLALETAVQSFAAVITL